MGSSCIAPPETVTIPDFVFLPFSLVAVWLLVAACAVPVRWSLGNALALLGVHNGALRDRAVRVLSYPLAFGYLALLCAALGRYLSH